MFVVGTGTSWHACNHGGYLLRAAGVDARPVEAFDAAIGGPMPVAGDALLLLSHRNTKRYATVVRERAAALGVPTVVITGIGAGGDIETVEGETTRGLHRQPSRRAGRRRADRRRAGRRPRRPRRRCPTPSRPRWPAPGRR